LDYTGLRDGTLCDQELFFSLTGLTANDVISGGRNENDLDEDYIKKFY